MTLRKAIWPGKCLSCHGGIQRGDLILSEKGEGSHHDLRHMYCPKGDVMPIPKVCQRCDGVGKLLWHSKLIVCPDCDGKGWARSTQILMEPKREQPAALPEPADVSRVSGDSPAAGNGSSAPSVDEWEEA